MQKRLAKRTIITLLIAVLSTTWLGFASDAQEPEVTYSLGLLPSPAGDYPQAHPSISAAALPEWIDLSDGLPPVGSQGQQASCVGWAIAYYYRSFQEGVENNRAPANWAEILSPAYVYNQRTTGNCSRDTGMTMPEGLRIAVSQGIAPWASMPYDGADTCSGPSADARAEAALYTSEGYLNLFAGSGTANLHLLKEHLVSGDPFLIAVPVYSDFYRATSRNAVIDVPKQNSTFYGGHALTVVGYDEARQTFKFVNSWGTRWGESGFGYLTYAFVKEQAWEAWMLIDRDTTPPRLPELVYELGGTKSGIAQTEVNTPVFAWKGDPDPTATYEMYWGPDPDGTGGIISSNKAFFAPGKVDEGSVSYLRLRAQDAAGNVTDWHTLFEFRHKKKNEESPLVAFQSTRRPTRSNSRRPRRPYR